MPPPSGEPNSALEQVKNRGYAEKYRGKPGIELFELGLVFSRARRNLVQFAYSRG